MRGLWGWLRPARSWAAERFEFSEVKMGAPFKLVILCRRQATADRAAKPPISRVDELNMIFSDYEPDSELSRLSRASPTREPVKLSDPLWAVLTRAQRSRKLRTERST